jgi:hypothetical protein
MSTGICWLKSIRINTETQRGKSRNQNREAKF